jgi:hypothetical protein
MDYQPGQFEIGDKSFLPQKMPAKKQFHVARRLAPVLGALEGLGPLFNDKIGLEGADKDLETMFAFIKPFANVLAKMNDDDAEYIINQCLAACAIMENGKPQRLRIDNRDMYENLNLKELVIIAVHTIKFNMADFTFTPQPASHQYVR